MLEFHASQNVKSLQLLSQVCTKLEESFSGEELQKKKDDHASQCTKNYDGTAGGMEVEAARVLWGRSADYMIRYVALIGDGDSGAWKFLLELSPYGPSHPVDKKECVNHVSKR